MSERQTLAGIELGGTKSIAVLASGTEILEQVSVPTTTPEETLPKLVEVLTRWHSAKPFASLGIASFGPLQLSEEEPDFGCMLTTPKPFWSQAKIAPILTSSFDCPWRIDTDVNGAALAEFLWGAGAGCNSLCYITIGTGLGGGVLVNGKPVHGAMHPEIGHLRFRRADRDTFQGACRFHGDCIEGLVSGPALAARFGKPTSEVADSDPRWADVAHDIAELASSILLTTSAQRVLFGGGVSNSRSFLLPMVRQRVVENLSSYLPFITPDSVEMMICAPDLGDRAGPLGAIALALSA